MTAPARAFSRVLLTASTLHALATAVAFFALVFLTRGGGEGFPDSPAVEAVAGVMRALAVPSAWIVERFIDPGLRHTNTLGTLVAVRLANSLLVGIFVASGWASVRAR